MSDTPRYKVFVEIIGVAIALFGVPAYFYSQYVDLQERRNSVSLDYIDRFQSGDALETRLRIYSKWSQSPRLAAFLQSKPSKDNLTRLILDLVKDDPRFGGDIVEIANLLDTIYFCVESKNCTLPPLQNSVIGPADSFLRLYGPYLNHLRNQGLTSSTGTGLEKLVFLGS